MKPSLATAARIMMAATQMRQQRRDRDRPLGVTAGADERQDRRRDHRPERGVGAENEDAGRAEEPRTPADT